MDILNVIYWMIFGAVAGIIANAIDPRPASGGILAAMVLGVVGAIVGGFLGNTLFGVGVTGFNVTSFIVAVGGSLLLLVAGRLISGSSRSLTA